MTEIIEIILLDFEIEDNKAHYYFNVIMNHKYESEEDIKNKINLWFEKDMGFQIDDDLKIIENSLISLDKIHNIKLLDTSDYPDNMILIEID